MTVQNLVDVLRLQSCTFMLTAVFTWVFMTVQNPGWCCEGTDHVCLCRALHLGAHSCVHMGLHDCVQNPGCCSEGTDHVCLCRTLHLGVHSWLWWQGFSWVLATVLLTRVSCVFIATHRLYVVCVYNSSHRLVFESIPETSVADTEELLQSIITRGSTQLGWCTTLIFTWER